jgi:hypothetical protein
MIYKLLSLSLVAGVAARGQGAWKDPKHYDPAKGAYAGMRYISEDPPDWYDKIDGSITKQGAGLTVDAIMSDDADRDGRLTWKEAGKTGTPADLFDAIDAAGVGNAKDGVITPSEAALFIKRGERSRKGLTMVGSDDGASWFTVTGWYDPDDDVHLHFDFSAKGGLDDVVGKWAKHGDSYAQGEVMIHWGDGNHWQQLAPTEESQMHCCNCGCGTKSGECGAGCSSCACQTCCAPA